MADWDKILNRGNVEDRRGMAPVAGGLSLTGVVLIIAFNYFTGGSLLDSLQQINNIAPQYAETQGSNEFAGEDSYEVFTSKVLGSANAVWTSKLPSSYTEPILVLFRQGTQSACGVATSQVGPHYCPLDGTIYIDETFFDELTNLLGARGGDVAEAYVIAHEVGHHVQNVQGTLQAGTGSNAESIQTELQADCYAGIWANSLKDADVFEPGEIEEAMDAAAAVGDDRIQEKVSGQVNPETWTHGSSEQRKIWFTRGYESGSVEACNTFSN